MYIHYTSLERNEDYTASGESIEFHVGETMRTHTIMINQDMTCEDTNEFSTPLFHWRVEHSK